MIGIIVVGLRMASGLPMRTILTVVLVGDIATLCVFAALGVIADL